MKIILIHCAETNFRLEPKYDSEGFAQACEQDREAGIAPVSVTRHDASEYRVYIGTDRAAIETVEALFTFTQPPERTALLDDVPVCAFKETKRQYPLWLWQGMGRLQWRLGSKRQPEGKKAVKQRVGELIDQIEHDGNDCVLIARGLLLKTLKDELYRRGYCIEGGSLRPKPLERIRATKKTLHCGGCLHNCLLSNPGCGIGMNKAKELKS